MSNQTPLYNSRITKIYVQYLRKYYPNIHLDSILKEAKISNFEIEEPAHWFTQEQVDRFHDIVVKKTGNPNISREVGRYSASSEGMGGAKQYVLGFMSPTSIYHLVEKIYPMMSDASTVRAQKMSRNRVEIVSIPKPGVKEKPYQCENRTGFFESLAKLFTKKFAKVDHPTCIHRGDESCRYIITWGKSTPHIWRRIRNYLLIFSFLFSSASFFVLSLSHWIIVLLSGSALIATLSFYSEILERKALAKTIEEQKEAAKDNIIESNIRYNNALLVQEIGQATSKILDIDMLLKTVAGVMEKRLDFDRGMIMLVNKERTRLRYSAGYGQKTDQEAILRDTTFSLENPESRGVFVLAIKEQKPFLINDISTIEESLSRRSLSLAKKLGSQSLICVPIVYEKESLGILAVDNSRTRRPLRQSDVSLLVGVASQLAISIMNAMSFEKLQESERKYRELVENANSIILRMDTAGSITFFNEFAQRFFGYAEKEILGKNAKRIILATSGSNRLSFKQLIQSLQDDPEPPVVSENETRLRNNEEVWIAWTYKPIFDDHGRLREILCIGNDITEIKRAANEKEDLQLQLQRAQKMEAIGTLAGGVAHDLNNILSGIVSYPELLLMDLKEESPLRKPILTIQKSGEKAAAIVQDLLTLARRGVAATEVVNLNMIVSDYLLSPEHARLELDHPNVTLRKHLDSNLLNILGSPVHLSKTIMNLISNAAEAMPNGGEISITTTNRHIDIAQNGYDGIDKGDYVCLNITDTGVGISSEDIERIFEPFYTKKAMGRSGTGLGMAVVWGTVKDHRGYIDVKSIEGKGTEITLYFPVTRKEFPDEADRVSIKDLMGSGELILIIDDVKEQREIASEMLSKLRYTIATVASGEEAVEFLRKQSVDLLVLDMIMEPGIDGLETYRRILKIRPEQKAIIASGYSESARVKGAQKLGAGAYIKKPYMLETIGRAIKTELTKQPKTVSSASP